MQLLPQSREALDEYVAPALDDLEPELLVIERWAVRTVPECVALSVTLVDDDLTFTWVAEDRLDERRPAPAVVGGASRCGDGCEAPLDEDEWAALARSHASTGIASSVSLPVVDHDRVVISIDLYASTAHAFHGRLADLAGALGAWQAGAVTNADLGFETRRRAEQAPARLRDQRIVDVAVGLIAARDNVGVDRARELLCASALAAGIAEVEAALVVRSLMVPA